MDQARLDISDTMARGEVLGGEGRSDPGLGPAGAGAPVDPHLRERVVQLAERIGKPVFDRVVEDLAMGEADEARLRGIRKSMANHYWCTLFVVLAQALDNYDDGWDEVEAFAKRHLVRQLQEILGVEQSHVVDRAAELLVEKSCDALRQLATAHLPFLAVADSPELRQALRVLAVLCCPAPERHADIARVCLGPLERDARGMLQDETRDRLRAAFGLEGEGDA
jgi:hypothetical protein